MEYEKFFNVNDPKTRQMIITYRHIASIYTRIKMAIDVPDIKASSLSTTTNVVFTTPFSPSSTTDVRW